MGSLRSFQTPQSLQSLDRYRGLAYQTLDETHSRKLGLIATHQWLTYA
ncbi:Uncharacterised protein [Vibrio cholerae]|nr:Uncharacterised protein [Vibrio cholerae]